MKRAQAGHVHSSSSGRGSRAKRALRRLSRPCQVSALPVRAVRVGRTQSNMSTPRSITSRIALRVADAHEVARPVLGQQRRAPRRSPRTCAPLLSDREPAERVAVEAELRDFGDRAPPQLGVGAALRDAESSWPSRARRGALASRPQRRAAHGLRELRAGDVDRRADVEAHGDVGAELAPGTRRRIPA